MEVDQEILSNKNLKEVSDEAVVTVSSARIGYGVDCLVDHNMETYWQSNGERPHTITFFFDEVKSIAVRYLPAHLCHSLAVCTCVSPPIGR